MRLDASQRDFRDEVRTFVDDALDVEYCRRCYQDREYPHELYDRVVEAGLIGTVVPEADGGRGRGHVEQVLLMEALGRYGYDFAVPALTTATVLNTLYAAGSASLRDRFVSRALAGECRFTVGVTEPDSGSNAAGLDTRAEREGDEYVVTGEKTYQSGAGVEDNYVHLYVRTDPDGDRHEGISALLVPIAAEGVTAEELQLVVRKAAGSYRLTFDGVRVPVENLVGEDGAGWSILTEHLISEHTYMAAAMVGTAQTVVDRAAQTARDRERFGRPIGEFQAVSHRLADMQTEVDAARELVYRSAEEMDATGGSRELTAKAKLKASETLREVSQHGMQLLGGASFDPENDMERYWREGMSATVTGGPSEIQRSIVARGLLRDE